MQRFVLNRSIRHMKQVITKVLANAALATAMTWALAGCQYGGKPQTLPPGAINTFDSDAYNTLVTAQGALSQAKKDFGSDPAAKTPLNTAIDAYNIAEHTWKTYHAAGGGDTADSQILQQELSALVAAIASLEKDFGKIKLQEMNIEQPLQPMSKI